MANAVSERKGETTRLGSFEIVRRLTTGGMAEIFLARTRGPSGFEKLVVLKKILPKYAGRQRYVQAFLDEARLGATLDHPNIVHVYDIGMVDGSYFFTMEHLHGQDVRSILHRAWRVGEKFPIEDAVQIARHVASALHFAHDKPRDDGSLLGIVHRDVSPSNIIVTYDGATKLLDFGVAKTTASSVKTRTGTLKGKVSYMSPEQARGAPIDRRSDIFSLGIVLWEMVTTQRLYRADNDLATLQMIIHQPAPPPRTFRPECPPELERIVLRALADDPDKRYQTADQLVTDLDELAREQKLKQSPSALAQTMNQLFAAELGAWREARARGVPLADHLHDVNELTTPVSESDFVGVEPAPDDDDDLDDLYDDDEPDDDDLTEHQAPIVDALPPPGEGRESQPDLSGAVDVDTVMLRPITGVRATPSVPFAKVAPSVPRAPRLATPPAVDPAAPIALASEAATAGHPARPATSPPGPISMTLPAAPVIPVTPSSRPTLIPAPPVVPIGSSVRAPAPITGDDDLEHQDTVDAGAAFPDSAGPDSETEMATVPPPPTPGPAPAMLRDPTGPRLTPIPGVPSIVPTAAAAPIAPTTALAPIAPTAGASFAPPWQSGQPGAPQPPEAKRSWAVVWLPPIDPEVFARRQKLVLRIAGGVVAFILLLAIIAGRC
ncbi:MAG TPA: protein kinase [Kofleriaceae bacterium]|nr:protein kinase [Kofleriaceae bacterium]